MLSGSSTCTFCVYMKCCSLVSMYTLLLTLAQRGLQYLVVRVSVCLSVCLLHLTYGASVRPENTVTYLAGKGGQKLVGFSLKPLSSRVMA